VKRIGSIVCAGALVACASVGRPSEGGLETSLEGLSQSPFSCVRGDDVQTYVSDLWQTLQDAWVLPAGVPGDQLVSVRIPFHADGQPARLEVVSATNEALRRSVEAAVAAAELPEPPDTARPCLALRSFRVDFANPAAPARAVP